MTWKHMYRTVPLPKPCMQMLRCRRPLTLDDLHTSLAVCVTDIEYKRTGIFYHNHTMHKKGGDDARYANGFAAPLNYSNTPHLKVLMRGQEDKDSLRLPVEALGLQGLESTTVR
jgi:hypothetical protein